ncbi:IgGFc-binding protein-like [Clavelina lepadiformis]|uniref:IgGFc-binding protein-like n=1 Tax=Clavelina lepadiformis TaxID=159417 RepID=UPI0040412EAF
MFGDSRCANSVSKVLVGALLITSVALDYAASNLIPTSRFSFRADVCQGQTKTISCQDPSHVMFIEDAFYGRADPTTCRIPSSQPQRTDCEAASSFRRIFRACNGQNSCTLTATTRTYGDPCPGTAKYIQFQFRCAEPQSNVIGFCFFDAWGPWVDVDNPSRGGDDELLEEHRRQTDSACDNPTGMQIQFVGRTGFPTGSDIIRQSLTYGLSCRNSDQPGTCKDYRVRYCCDRAPTRPVTRTCPQPLLQTPTIALSPGKPTWNPGESIVFTCPQSYDLRGPAIINCLENGQWDGNPPRCIRLGCAGFANPSNGVVSSTKSRWNVRERVTFTCDSSYDIQGQATLVCLTSGDWSHDIPSCVATRSIGCGGRITGQQSGEFTSPNYPNDYPSSSDCTWSIVVNQGQIIEIVFTDIDVEFQERCPFDYIEIYNGTNRNTGIHRFCGTIVRRVFRSNIPSLTTKFRSDNIVQTKGFTASWRAIQADAPELPEVSYCYSAGDPHYGTFDGRRYDFQGTCTYTLVRNVRGAAGIPSFSVEVDNEVRGNNPRVSWLGKAYVRIGDSAVIELMKGRVVAVGGERVNLPYVDDDVTIRLSGRFVEIKTPFDLTIIYDGDAYLTLSLPRRFAEKVQGLCGNYNGNPDDDFQDINSGATITDISQFANQFQTNTERGCRPHRPEQDEECPALQRASYANLCSIVSEENGCFSRCHSLLNPAPFLSDCIFDACAYRDAQTAIENNVGAYARRCQDLGATLCPTWRVEAGIPLICGENSRYSDCTSRCPATCGLEDDSECEEECVEGCECNDGYILSGDTCVKRSDCGCTFQGKYYKNGESFYSTSSCSRKCTCEDGKVNCVNTRCGDGETCSRDDDGRRACIPTGFGICRAWGDPHYKMFDSDRQIDFQGNCSYYMARTHTLEQSDPRWFSIETTNEHRRGHTRVSYLRDITIRLSGDIVVRLEKDQVVKVNDQVVQEYDHPLFTIRPSGQAVIFTMTNGPVVRFNGNGLLIRAPNTYMGQVQGLCGNFNGNPDDDLVTSSGTPTTDINEFGQSYVVGSCEYGVPPDPVCSQRDTEKWGGANYCGMLTNRNGVFSTCHQAVDVQDYFEKCVYDVCATDGDQETFNQVLEQYAAECQFNEIQLCNWRNDTEIAQVQCPANSHYEGCSTPCPDSCAQPYASFSCAIPGEVEDCRCNFGYIRDGDKCVRKSECGCTVDGLYISKDFRFVKKEDNEECSCLGQNEYRCACLDGYSGQPCRDINECRTNPCDENASCTNTDGSFVCRCNAGYTGDGTRCRPLTCERLENPSAGSVTYSRGLNVGSAANFACNSGYRRQGSARLLCQASLRWNRRPPTCVDVDECLRSPCDDNAACTNTEGSYSCRCNEGYTGNGAQCTPLNCPRLQNPANGVVTVDELTVGSTASYGCRRGYRLVGNTRTNCRNTLTWSSAPPRCIDIDECRTTPCNALADCRNTAGSYQCTCREGYTGNGRRCTDINECNTSPCHRQATCSNTAGSYLCECGNGFTGDGTTCAPLGCRGFRNPDFGLVSSTKARWNVDESIIFTCNRNYIVRGEGTLTCQRDGQWSDDEPVCVQEQKEAGTCGSQLTGQSGEFQTPNHPGNYPALSDCVWTITVNPGQFIEVIFNNVDTEFASGCPFDYVELYNGTSPDTGIHKFCGTIRRRVFRSNENTLTVRFRSDNLGHQTGFSATWRAIGDKGPRVPAIRNCYAVGDPHYGTFDGRRFDFQGVCSYILVRTSAGATGVPQFSVEVDNEYRGRNRAVSWLRKAYIRVGNSPVIEFTKGNIVKVGGEVINLPYYDEDNGVSIQFSGRFVELTNPSGLKVLYDGDAHLRVMLPRLFAEKVEGLCGNYNGNPDDDFLNINTGDLLTDPNEFANQYQTDTKAECRQHRPEEDDICPLNIRARYAQLCSVLTAENGCFSRCYSRLDPAPFLEDCIFDACAYRDSQTGLENTVGAYARYCQDLGVTICPDWRETAGTPLLCGENSHYSSCMDRCSPTCGLREDSSSCEGECVEGCECDDGYIRSGDVCVKQSECGCSYEDRYYKNGESFYSTPSCTRQCTCEDGSVTCRNSPCRDGETCGQDDNGRTACIPTEFGICRAWGDPHYQTYDSKTWVDFQGNCTYYMSRTNTLGQSNPRWFSIEATNERRHGFTRVSYLRDIIIRLANGDVIRLEKDRVAKVNGQVVQEFDSPEFTIHRTGRAVVFTMTNGPSVSFNGNGVRIKVPSTYAGQLDGLCGNYNGVADDDLTTSSGVLTTDVNEWAQSYQVGSCEYELPPPVDCTRRNTEKWRGQDYCGPLMLEGGVFSSCSETIDAEAFFEKCVFDLCATQGNRLILEEALEVYAAECQFNDIELCSWRNDTKTAEIECPPNSHYDACASPCPDSCANPAASANCVLPGVVEDCVCDIGHIRDGDFCVRRSECGCIVNGIYVSKGNRVTRTESNEECGCLGQNQYECACLGGYRGSPCRDINECARNPCDVNAVCTNTAESYICRCRDGYSGNGRRCRADEVCSPPPAISNGIFTPLVFTPQSVGTTISYECNDGYRFSSTSSDTIVCEEGGIWSDSPPTCIAQRCPRILSPIQGGATYTNGFAVGSVARYRCNRGYRVVGSNPIRCGANLRWSDIPPTCVERRCDLLTAPAQARVTYTNGNEVGSQARFTCVSGYRIEGTSRLVCQSSLSWSSTPPVCIDINECQQTRPPCHTQARCVNNDGSYQCVCNEGYTGSGRVCTDINECLRNPCHRQATCANSRGSFRCECNEGYNGDGIICEREPLCPPPPVVSNAETTTPTPNTPQFINTRYTYRCLPGYRFATSGRATIRCLDTGLWSNVPPNCIAIRCVEPKTPSRGTFTVQPVYDYDSVVTFSCLPGYRMRGNRQIRCTERGRWSSTEPVCAEIDECSRNPPPCHLEATCTNTDGSYLCVCKEGYTGNGKNCRKIQCEDLSFPSEGSITFSAGFNPGSVATFGCDSGYQVNGANRLVCDDNLKWSDIPPTCIDINECTIEGFSCGDGATCRNTPGSYQCDCSGGQIKVGSECRYIICEEPELPEQVSIRPPNALRRVFRDVVFYSCPQGFHQEGSNRATCQRDGTWSHSPPTCKREIRDLRYCTVSGDPHYDTLDGLHYEYQGKCLYDLIKTTGRGPPSLVQFQIETENENRLGLTHVTWMRRAIFRFPEVSVELRKELIVLVDNMQVNLPYSHSSGIRVERSGRYVVIMTDFGLLARYDGDHYLTVGLPATYSGFVEGLCGNYNGDPSDDLTLRDSSEIASDSVGFGNSFQINSPAECSAAIAQSDSPCEGSIRRQYENQCNIIREETGCFSTCHKTIDPGRLYTDCVFDLCASGGNNRALEQNVAAYAAACQSNDVDFCDWRSRISMPMLCPKNSRYNRCMSGCPDTCVNRDASKYCPEACVEGCECNEGFIMSGDECTRSDQCGCQSEGRYYKDGERFYTSGCGQRCTCSDGTLSCSSAGCGTNERCAPDENGVLGCRIPQIPCNPRPIPKMIELPFCLNNDRTTQYVDVGSCPSSTCSSGNSRVSNCCGAVAQQMIEVSCRGGSTTRISKITECGCSRCQTGSITVTGMVYGVNKEGEEIVLANGNVMSNNRTSTRTDRQGQFTITVNPNVGRLVLTFSDPEHRFMKTTKVLPFKRLGGAIFHRIKIPVRAPTSRFSSNERGDFSPYSDQENVIKIEIEPTSYFDKSGDIYIGTVTYSVTSVDTRQRNSYVEAPSDMRTNKGEMIRSYGIFEMDFRDIQDKDLLIRNIRISLNSNQVNVRGDRDKLRLWSLDSVTGYWTDEGEMAPISSGTRDVYSANLPVITYRRTLCIGVQADQSCFMKVRTYGSDEFSPYDQVSYATVNAAYRERGNSWRSFGSALSRPDAGACVPMFCDVANPNLYTANTFSVIDGDEFLDAASSAGQNSDVIGVSGDILPLFNYRRQTVYGSGLGFSVKLLPPTNATYSKGPFYRELYDCLSAPTEENHFRFHRSRLPSTVKEFDTVRIDERNAFFSWRSHPLAWWPDPNQYRACYIKVKLVGNSAADTAVRVTSTVGTIRARMGQIYGIREDQSVGNNREAAACIEFKCSGITPDQNIVTVMPLPNSCRRTRINQRLQNYLTSREPYLNQRSPRNFRLFAPPDPLDPMFGIYTVTNVSPEIAKRLALGRCMAGSSNQISQRVRVDDNEAVTFTC